MSHAPSERVARRVEHASLGRLTGRVLHKARPHPETHASTWRDFFAMEDGSLREIVRRHGVFLRREALAMGYDDRAVTKLHATGAWIRVRHGAYTFADLWNKADLTERYRIRSRAVLRTHGARAVLSHTSAVLEHPVHHWGLDLTRTHITRTDGSPGRSSGDVHQHVGLLRPTEVTKNGHASATGLARALVETTSINTTEAGLIVVESALHQRLVTMKDLEAHRRLRANCAGARRTDLVLRLAGSSSESVAETRTKHLLWRSGVPAPVQQYAIHDATGRFVAVVDFAWPELGVVLEFDGKLKYERYLKPGESPGDAVFREKVREDRLRAAGWRVVRITWKDLSDPERVAGLVLAALAPR